MSRKPTIKLSYPDASTLAMQLTDAMIRRAPGKRILETTSEDKAGDGEGSLLDGLNSVRTSTGVEMTLTLEPNSMDYALEQLIRPNLTEEEKKAIFGETENELKLETPDQEKQIDVGKIPDRDLRTILADLIHNVQAGGETADHIQDAINAINDAAGVIDLDETYDEERDLRTILADLVDAAQGYVQGGQDAWEKYIENAIETAIKEIDHRAGVIDLDETCKKEKQIDRDLTKQIAAALNVASLKLVTTEELKQLENFASSLNAILIDNDEEMQETYIRIGDLRKELIHARYFGGADANKRYIELQEEINPNTGIPWREYEAFELRENKTEPPPHEKIAAAAQEREKLKKAKKSRKKKQEPSWDDVEAEARKIGQHKTDETDKTDEIEPGLLDDLDDGSDGMAPAEEVMGHDE